MTELWRRRWLLGMLAMLALAATGQSQQPPAADVTEIRDFVVQVGGKQVGHTQLVITDRKDGTTVVNNKANVQVKFIITYNYSYQGTEVWKNYQLLQLDGQCDDNAKKFTVRADYDAKANALRVQASGKEQAVKPEAWTTSYWKLPDPKFHNAAVTLVDADRGDIIGGQLQYVGTEELTIAAKKQKCYRFKVVGPKTPVNLWFDAHHRLVRQEFTESGHRTIIELVSVRR